MRKSVHFLESWGRGQGIGGHGTASSLKKGAAKFKLPDVFASPIDTSWAKPAWALLSDDDDRPAIVKMLEDRLGPLKAGK